MCQEGRFGGVDMPRGSFWRVDVPRQPCDPAWGLVLTNRASAAAFPDVETREITRDWEFVVMACDGIWDVLTNQVSPPCHLSSAL